MTEHGIYTFYEGDRAYWECSCGRSGSCREDDDVNRASDRHIDRESGDTRYDTSRAW